MNNSRNPHVIKITGLIGLLSGLVLVPIGCTRNQTTAENIRVEDLKENTAAYLGKTVTVSGEIEEIYGPRAFKLGGKDFFDSEIRVITSQPLKASVQERADQPFRKDDIALVTGTVRNVVIADVEREFSFDLDPNYEIEFESRPAIIATSVLISPRGQSATVATGSNQPTQITDIAVIHNTTDKATLVGRTVQLNKVNVQKVVGDQSFLIGTGNQQVFVTFNEIPSPGTAKEGQVAIKAGQKVSLNGTIRSLPALSEEWLKQNKVDSTTAKELKQQPIYIHASDVRVEQAAG
ncbi:MAG TPA: hypothetical protein VFO10_05310 [Oligoflexus sp.]|uniref:hypothetical protein n=1 Tax=Oligoflexus sp. TaxID=1971216 RepID=UPI002D811225|nr:hypothetical protein [Oligoflexus sp.]HET9236643.1 hypothetical protein [Oligoflexus sp.]